jgi:hypothetical protein
MSQLMGFASQRLMAEGYGFGAEGDWKTAALCRTMWVMAQGLPGGLFIPRRLCVEFRWCKQLYPSIAHVGNQP